MVIFHLIMNELYESLVYKNRYTYILDGLGTTLSIAFIACIMGVVIGTIVALTKVIAKGRRTWKPLEIIANAYLTIIRGTPVVVQLFIIYYVILSSSGTNKVVAAMICFGINSGAYVAEIIRTGILSVDEGQIEAGRSLGLPLRKTYTKIVFPQALKNILPALGNEFIALLKETSVAGFIGVMDLSKAGDIIRSQTYEPVIPLLTTAGIYLIMVVGLTTLLGKTERSLRKSDNG